MRAVLAMAAAMLVSGMAVAQDTAPASERAAGSLPRVSIETSAGTMVVEADTVRAPVTAANFLRYVDGRKLDGVTFYRVVKVQPGFGFVQFGQKGDPARSLPPIRHEPTTETGLSHIDGVLSVARLEPGSARGEFTIMVGDNSHGLDAPNAPEDKLGYAAFGRVVEGREVLGAILDTPIDPARSQSGAFRGEMPATPVRIIKARRLARQ